MAIETLGSPTVVPPTRAGTEARTIPTNAGVFQAEIAVDSVTQQVQQVQESAPQSEAPDRNTRNEQPSQGQQAEQSAPPSEQRADDERPAPVENRGGNINIQV